MAGCKSLNRERIKLWWVFFFLIILTRQVGWTFQFYRWLYNTYNNNRFGKVNKKKNLRVKKKIPSNIYKLLIRNNYKYLGKEKRQNEQSWTVRRRSMYGNLAYLDFCAFTEK